MFADSALQYSDPEVLSGRLPIVDDGFSGPINVSVGQGFPFAGQFRRTVFVSSEFNHLLTHNVVFVCRKNT